MTDNDGIRQSDAQQRYYMHVADPSGLGDWQWAEKLKQLADIRQKELGK